LRSTLSAIAQVIGGRGTNAGIDRRHLFCPLKLPLS
jgi:hypothetical protein